MGTTLAQDATNFDNLRARFGTKPTRTGTGTVVLAGSYWPPLTINTPAPMPPGSIGPPPPITRPNPGAALKRRDAQTAVAEAQAMILPAYLAASGAVSGSNTDALPIMERWFGTRPTGPFTGNKRDWWLGVVSILGVIEALLTGNVNLYYRGDNSVIGQPNDYPGKIGNLGAYDVVGYAETYAVTSNSVIGLCSLFFAKQVGTGQSRMKLKGFDSVGGTLVHELSHNLCSTMDHEKSGGGTAYGTTDCKNLAIDRRRRAWYNADNIEYFCEEIAYPTLTGTPPTPITSGSTTTVSSLRTLFNR